MFGCFIRDGLYRGYCVVLDSINRVSIKNIDLQGSLVFVVGQAKLILPSGREHRYPGCLWLTAVLCNALEDLRRIQVESDQILTIGMDDLAEQLISVVEIPFHHLKELRKKELACYLSRFPPPSGCIAPGESIPR